PDCRCDGRLCAGHGPGGGAGICGDGPLGAVARMGLAPCNCRLLAATGAGHARLAAATGATAGRRAAGTPGAAWRRRRAVAFAAGMAGDAVPGTEFVRLLRRGGLAAGPAARRRLLGPRSGLAAWPDAVGHGGAGDTAGALAAAAARPVAGGGHG